MSIGKKIINRLQKFVNKVENVDRGFELRKKLQKLKEIHPDLDYCRFGPYGLTLVLRDFSQLERQEFIIGSESYNLIVDIEQILGFTSGPTGRN